MSIAKVRQPPLMPPLPPGRGSHTTSHTCPSCSMGKDSLSRGMCRTMALGA